jgi:hypothetical protein
MANEYQKCFAQSLWRICVPVFRAVNSPPVNQLLKFIYNIFKTCGTDEDKNIANFVLPTKPMFYYILKLVNQVRRTKDKISKQSSVVNLLLINYKSLVYCRVTWILES